MTTPAYNPPAEPPPEVWYTVDVCRDFGHGDRRWVLLGTDSIIDIAVLIGEEKRAGAFVSECTI